MVAVLATWLKMEKNGFIPILTFIVLCYAKNYLIQCDQKSKQNSILYYLATTATEIKKKYDFQLAVNPLITIHHKHQV